jgi:hypothetical protein
MCTLALSKIKASARRQELKTIEQNNFILYNKELPVVS